MSYFSYYFAKTMHFANSKYDYIKLEDITYINKWFLVVLNNVLVVIP